MAPSDGSSDRGAPAIGRRGFLKVAAAGVAAASGGLPPAEAGAPEAPATPARPPGSGHLAASPPAPDPRPLEPAAAPQIARARWRERRVDFGEEAHIVVEAPRAADGTPVLAAVYRLVGRFRRHLGNAHGRVQSGEAHLVFRCAPVGPVDGEGLHALTFRARVGASAERLFPSRALEVLCTRPRFSA